MEDPMKANLRWLAALFVSLWIIFGWSQSAVASQCTAGETAYTVKAGDTLSGVVGKQWKAYADVKGMKSPYTIRIGQALCVSQGTRVNVSITSAAVAPTRFIDLNRAPANRYGDLATQDKLIDINPLLSQGQKAEAKKLFREGKCEKRMITSDMVWQAMPFRSKDGSVKFAKNVRVRDASQGGKVEVACFATLSDGTVVGNPLSCGNTTPVIVPKSQVAVPAEKLPEPPPVAPPQSAVPMAASPVASAGPCANMDPKAVIGGEYERNMSAHFASAGLFCLWRGEGGSHGVGAGVNASFANGTVPTGGKFKSELVVGGPGYEWISDDNWDVGVRLNVGQLGEEFREGQFKSGRQATVWGPSAEYNNSQRRARGEQWFAKTQVFAMYLTPLSVSEWSSFNGVRLPDTNKFSSYFNAGVRQYIYDGKDAHVYAQLGYLQENPNVSTMNVRIGVADPDEIVGVHAGFDKDLRNGSVEPAIGWWVDLVQGTRVYRNGVRQAQIKGIAAEQGINTD
jgi:hypothetical protein